MVVLGHINHTLFWKNLVPVSEGGGKLGDGPLKQALERDFGSIEKFKEKMNTTTASLQGSGWGWLGYNESTGKLEIVTTANQDPLLSHTPIIGIDIWEHAFYLQYKNVKPDVSRGVAKCYFFLYGLLPVRQYLKAIWNVVNFKEAEKRFVEATQQSA